MSAWLVLALRSAANFLDELTDTRHLRTDPACREHRAPRRGSALDRISRGASCYPCEFARAFGWMSDAEPG